METQHANESGRQGDVTLLRIENSVMPGGVTLSKNAVTLARGNHASHIISGDAIAVTATRVYVGEGTTATLNHTDADGSKHAPIVYGAGAWEIRRNQELNIETLVPQQQVD